MMQFGLFGGEEFAPGFEKVHAQILKRIGSKAKRVVFLPTCAADDGPEAVSFWCKTAKEKLGKLGATVDTPFIVDKKSANDPKNVERIKKADWIYFGGGYPHVGMRILKGSLVLKEIYTAAKRKVLITGSSGGAMLLCAKSWIITQELIDEIGKLWESGVPKDYDPQSQPQMIDCLNLIPNTICWPHFNRTFFRSWLKKGLLQKNYTLIGIDEETACVASNSANEWKVLGKGKVTIIRSNLRENQYSQGQEFYL